jgi:D-glycero-D-manno-heptose 1,7-bisphosphate phosphatase
MFLQAFREFPGASPQNSIMIGDSISDIEAGHRLGMPTIFINGEQQFQKPGSERAVTLASAVANSLLETVELYFPIRAPESH